MRALPLLLLLAACGRPLSEGETAFIGDFQGPTANFAARFHDGLASAMPRTIAARPRLTCQQRIWPPPEGPTVRVGTHAMTIFNDVYYLDRVYADDFLPDYPDSIYLPDAMLFAHEMVHVWQWQNRAATGYHPLRAAFEHLGSDDPYLFDPDTEASFQSFGYEQQGSIFEEYICCRALAPDAERTARLDAMLRQVFDLPPLERSVATEIWLPWDGVDLDGICDVPEA